MKKKTFDLLIIPAVLLILLYIFSGNFAKNEEHRAEQLLKERQQIFTAVQEGELSAENGKKRLREIETETFYQTDSIRLKKAVQSAESRQRKTGTEDSPAGKTYLKSIKNDHKYYQYSTYRLTAVRGETEMDFRVSLQKEGQEYKLSMLQREKQ